MPAERRRIEQHDAPEPSIGIHDALTLCRELPWRRALPAAAGGGPVLGATAPSRAAGGPVFDGAAAGRAAGAVVLDAPARRSQPSPPTSAPCRPRRRLLLRLVALTAALLTLLIASSAHAEEVFTSQAAAANATDSTWIPAPAQRAALCIVDTGNDPNPDTSNVIARLSVDGEPGTDRSPTHHGTLMSMIAAAPYNGFGMVGAAPSINIVSVRASRDGTTFGGTDLAAGIQLCLNKRMTYNIKVISLSLGGAVVSGLDIASMATIEDMVRNVRRAGIDVVAAAGNHRGPVDWPAGYDPVLAVGGADADGKQCAFAASGPEVDLWTAGCPLDAVLPDGAAAWASGSSESTALLAAVLAQLRQLAPDLTVDQAEHALMVAAQRRDAGAWLDVAAAYVVAGLRDQLAAGAAAALRLTPSGEAIEQKPTPVASAAPVDDPRMSPIGLDITRPEIVASSPITSPRRRLPRPFVRAARVRHGVLSLSFANRPPGIEARLQIYARSSHSPFPRLARTVIVAHDRLRTRVSGEVGQVSITYRDPTKVRDGSVVLILHPGT